MRGRGIRFISGGSFVARLVLAGLVAGAALALPGPAAADPALTFGSRPSVAELQDQARDVRAEIKRLDERLGRSVEEYDSARAKLDALNAQLAQARTDLQGAETRLGVAQSILSASLAQMYKTGRLSLLDVLFSSGSLTDITVQLDFYRLISESDEATVEEIDELTRQVASLEQSIAARRDQAMRDEVDVRAKRAVVEDQLAQRQAVLRGLDSRIKKMLARERRAAAQAADRLARSAGVALDSINGTAAQVAVIRETMRWLGVDYVWGGASPQGFDCSGLVLYVYAKFGVDFPHGATMQAHLGTPVPLDELQPADLVFFGTPSFYHHVGIYAGNGLFIEAPHTGDVVKVSVLAGRDPSLACRYPITLP